MEGGRERRYNAHRECTEQSKQPYKALVGSWKGGRTSSTCSRDPAGVAWSYHRALGEFRGHRAAPTRHRNQRNCLQRRHGRPTSSIRMREGLRTKASILPHPPSLYRLRSGILTHFTNPLQSPFLPQWRENKITSLSSEEDVSVSLPTSCSEQIAKVARA